MNVRWLAAVVGALVLVAGTASAQDAKVAQGEKLYAAQKCSMCHAVAGKGNAKGTLDEVGTKLSADEIRNWLVNPTEAAAKHKATRKPVMPSYAKLSKDDIDALVAYMQSLKKK